MSKVMEDYGMLDAENKLTTRAEDIFLSHVETISSTGKSNLPFSCYEGKPNPNSKYLNVRDEKRNKSFYDNWVRGTYADAVRMLNVESNIALPIFDPFALPAKVPDLGLKIPSLSLGETLAFMVALPPDPQEKIKLSLLKCGINPEDLANPAKLLELLNKVFGIINPVPTIPKLPLILPPVDFPDISVSYPGFNLVDRKLRILTSIPTVFLEIFKEFSDPTKLLSLIAKGPDGFLDIFSSTCKAFNKALPPPAGGEASSTAITYQAAIVSSLAKPTAVAIGGSIFGSAQGGLTGGLGRIGPDAPRVSLPEINLDPEAVASEVPIEWTTPVSGNKLVKSKNTRLTGNEAKAAIIRGWTLVFNQRPPESVVNILLAQFSLETGRGNSMYNYNFGGVKGSSPAGLTTAYGTFEVIEGKEIKIKDNFRAYRSADEGAWDWIGFLQKKFQPALDRAVKNDPTGYVKELKRRGYFTADLDLYTRVIVARTKEAEKNPATLGSSS